MALILLGLPFFLNLGVSALWDANEAFYTETPREMIERGDYIYPTFNYEPRVHKPPLSYWIIAASYRLLGVSELSARLPSAIAVCVLLGFLIYFLCNHRWTTAILAASILATTPRFFIVARRLPIDCFLAVFLTFGLLFVYWALQSDKTSNTAFQTKLHHHWKWATAGFFTGLAFLTKGPVALILLMIIVAVFAWMEKRRVGLGALVFLAAFLLAGLPYYLLLYQRGGSAAIYNFFIRENLGRYTTVDFSPSRVPSYFFEVLLADALPWSWFLPAAVFLWKSWRPARRSLLRFCWIWFLTVLIFFSFSHTKEEYYILPAYPALAILLAHFFAELPEMAGKGSKVLRTNALAVAAGLIGVGVLFLRLGRILSLGSAAWMLPLLLVFGALVMLRLFWRGEPSRAAEFLSMLLLLVIINVTAIFLPTVEILRPTRRLTEQVARILQPEDRPGYFRFTSPSMCFYLRRHISELFHNGELEADLDKPGRSILLMQAEDYSQLPGRIQDRMEIAASAPRFPTRGKELLKIRSAADLPQVVLVVEKGK